MTFPETLLIDRLLKSELVWSMDEDQEDPITQEMNIKLQIDRMSVMREMGVINGTQFLKSTQTKACRDKYNELHR